MGQIQILFLGFAASSFGDFMIRNDGVRGIVELGLAEPADASRLVLQQFFNLVALILGQFELE